MKFEPGGEQVITVFGPPNENHAYAASEPGAKLVSAVAQVEGTTGTVDLGEHEHEPVVVDVRVGLGLGRYDRWYLAKTGSDAPIGLLAAMAAALIAAGAFLLVRRRRSGAEG